MTLLKIIGLNKTYKDKQVLTDFSLELHKGEIMGLIGGNGAGKTSIFKSILGLVKMDSGVISINSKQIDFSSKDYLEKIGTIIEYPTFYESLTAKQNLLLTSKLYKLNKFSDEHVSKFLSLVGLENEANNKVSKFSLGMKQRLGLAQALIHDPIILLLDEPFNGLDPKGVKEFRELLLSLSIQGVGIIISSHSLEELNKIVDTVTIIDKGKLIFQGTKSEYLALGGNNDTWFLETDNKLQTQSLLNTLKIEFKITENGFELDLPSEIVEDIKGVLFMELVKENISILNFSKQQKNFEDIFLNIYSNGEVNHA